jgi:nicotinate dehydrogenase subunit B
MTADPRRGDGRDALVLDLDRRAFLGAVSGGLAVVCTSTSPEAPAAQAPAPPADWSDRGARSPKQVAAWLHVAQDGSVSAFTGKVEIGQNVRTSLAQAVAEELRVPFDAVLMVMGDTARTPFDIGTFGSLTTSANMPLLRHAAVTAREALIDLAARRLGVDRGELTAVGGKVEHRPTGRSIGYGDLTQGAEIIETVGDAPLTPADQWTVAGHSMPKVDGRSFVTGRHRYAADIKRPGLWYGKVLRAPGLGATRTAVDTTAAEVMPGVVVVRGEMVGVAAADEAMAARTLKAIKATWKPAPPTCSDATLAEYLRNHASGRRTVWKTPAPAVDEVRLERIYTAAFIAHVPLEPRCAVAEWEGDRLTVWTSSQRPFGARAELSRAFGLRDDQVRVIVPDMGSGYGGKHSPEADIEAARLAKAARHPVRVAWTRDEEFAWGYFRPAGLVEASACSRQDGTLTAWEFHTYNAGPPGMNSPYDVPAADVQFHPCEAPLRQGAYRALASTFNHFARESLINEVAFEVHVDPLEFRLRNTRDERLRAVLQAAAGRFGWGHLDPKNLTRGVGIAGGHDKGSAIATCAEVEVPTSGEVRVVRLVAAFEAGAVVNPDHLTNQVQGALMMGLGGALFEAMRFENGVLRNGRLSRYRVPRFADLPKIDVVLLDRKDITPAGAGEIPIVAVAPAIAAAIFGATGKRLRSLPLAPWLVGQASAQWH